MNTPRPQSRAQISLLYSPTLCHQTVYSKLTMSKTCGHTLLIISISFTFAVYLGVSRTGQLYTGKLTSWFPLAEEGDGTWIRISSLTRSRHLKPGGYIEQVEISIEVKSDDGTVTSDSPLVKFCNVYPPNIVFIPILARRWTDGAIEFQMTRSSSSKK